MVILVSVSLPRRPCSGSPQLHLPPLRLQLLAFRHQLPHWLRNVHIHECALHLFLPFAVTLTIGFTLRSFGSGDNGWTLLIITAVLLYLVMYFEFVSCDPASVFRPLSIIVLDSLCYAVFLLFMIALRANVSRLILSLPAALILCITVSLKIYSFHIIGSSIPLLSFVTGLMIVFAETGQHYMPINIVSYGTLMFLWYYTVTSFIVSADRNESFRLLRRRLIPAWSLGLIVLIYSAAGL